MSVAIPWSWPDPALLPRHEQVAHAAVQAEAALEARWQRALEGLAGKWQISQSAEHTWWVDTQPGAEHSAHQYTVTDRDGVLRCSCLDFTANRLGVCKHILAVLAWQERQSLRSSDPQNIQQSMEVSEMSQVNKDHDAVLEVLALPFAADAIEWKCGARSNDRTRGIALAYVDSRDYIARLNEVFGLDWEDTYVFTVAENRLLCVCTLKIHLPDGRVITRTGDGECALSDDNATTVASAQAFKRSCVKFGLGAFLYSIPQQWVTLENERYIPRHIQEGLRAAYEQWTETGQWRFGDDEGTPSPRHATPTPAEPSAPSRQQRPSANNTAQGPGAMVVKFGKFKDQPIASIYEQEPNYVAWLAENANFQPLRVAAEAYLGQMAHQAA